MLLEMGVRVWERAGTTSAAVASSDEETLVVDVPIVDARGEASALSSQLAAPAVVPSSSSSRDAEWLPADWLVVGEPFDTASTAVSAPSTAAVGDQERLLGHMLQAIRVVRDKPEREGRAAYLALPDGVSPAQHRSRLDMALDRVAPRLILALGRAAAEAVLDSDEPLGRLRGTVHERGGARVVVSFPLAYLLRHPAEKAKAWADLCLGVRALDGESTARP